MKQAALTNEALGITRKEVDTVVENDVAEVIAGWTGIPVTKISDSESKWFGVTYKEDKDNSVKKLASYTRDGIYPSPLWI